MAYIQQPQGSVDSAPSNDKRLLIGAVAESSTPSQVGDGDVVDLWTDLFGRLIIYGANQSLGALDVQDISPALQQTLERIDDPLLDAVTATGASDAVDVSMYNKMTFHIVASNSPNATVKIQHSLDNSNWVDVNTTTVSSAGTTEVAFSDVKYKYVRANITAHSNGTFTVTMMAGN
jgi:hypothetical protein